MVTTMVVVSAIWFLLYNPSHGFINQFLHTLAFGLTGNIDWLQNPHTALPAIMIMSIWQGAGFQMVFFLIVLVITLLLRRLLPEERNV